MRQIRFRAWNKTTKTMVDLQKITPFATELPGLFIPHDDDLILMQFTGLHDKNGKEIWEGDILRLVILEGQIERNLPEALRVVVEFQNGGWGFRHTHPNLVCEEDREWRAFWNSEDKEMWSAEYFEVIGNIYEQSHLEQS